MKRKSSQETCFMLSAELLIIIPSILHIVISSFMEIAILVASILITVILSTLNTYLLLKTTFMDPGYIPKLEGDPPEAEVVTVEGKEFTLKACETCNILKPIRSHHCRVCNRCVLEMDHHCPWVANCIGKNNKKHFVSLLIFAFCQSALIGICNLFFLLEGTDPEDLEYLSIVLLVISGVVVVSVGGLMLYHFYLISINQTTHEHMRKLYRDGNPHKKSCLSNCRSFWNT